MNPMYIESIRGYPYKFLQGIADEFGISKDTVRKRVAEIEQEVKNGRYNKTAIIRDGNICLVNVLVFLDYEANRQRLREKNMRKYVEPYDPKIWVEAFGWHDREVAV